MEGHQNLAKEKTAFRKMFDEYYDRIYSYTLIKISNQEDVEDIVQEIFFHLWKHRESLFSSVSPESIVVKTTNQKIADFYRSNNIIGFSYDFDLTENNDELSIVNDYQSEEDSISEQEDANQKIFRIKGLLENLPERRKKIFILNKFEDHSYQQIADEMSMSRSAVENQISKTIKYLKANLNLFFSLILFFCIL